METIIHLINIKSVEELPRIEDIIRRPRHQQIKILFEPSVLHLRESYGEDLKETLPNHLIAIHTIDPEINISKLISDEEIILNQAFFIQCAKDYRILGNQLVHLFCKEKKIKLNEKFPSLIFNNLKDKKNQSGKVGKWKYFIHGFHCHFKNIKTGQEIEVPFMFGMEFGVLDPYFFVQFIKSTPKFQPLPVDLHKDYHDGNRILKVLFNLGLLEKINSNLEGHTGIVIKDREKIEINTFTPEDYFEVLKPSSKWSRLLHFFKF
ncbi:DUF6896 domain-containing protein [Chryseobacterium sp. c4a]|uniref:DUF6896 domain-containing protein n=1 Tax=Chryseobacterium sp. c4a TaxID=1573582 RepID=UPI00162ABB9C|nr:hypothetical protein [Chryseobacterium sp. c4a]